MKPSRFERIIAFALVVASTLPLLPAVFLAARLVSENFTVWLAPRVVDRLQSIPLLYGELFQARKQLYAEQVREIALGLPKDPRLTERYLESAIARTPRLRRISYWSSDGEKLAESEAKTPFEEGEWREAPARVSLRDGDELECIFAIEARFFADLSDARDLGEQVRNLDQYRTELPRSYGLAFGVLLVFWVCLAASIGIWLARRTTRRVTGLVGAVRKLAGGDLSVQVDPGRSQDEVADLARAFNTMVKDVREGRDRIVYLEKISGWQDVARRLAHEIKNPLTPILLAFQQLEATYEKAPGEPKFSKLVKEAGQIVREEIATLQRLVEEFSSFAKLPEVRAEPADLAEFAAEFVATSPQLTEKADVEVTRLAPEALTRLDRTLFRRVLSNLCQNAIEAAKSGRAKVHLVISRAEDRVLLTVSDEGPGIEPSLRERIFDPYFTTKGTGTGLGLAIVKKIVLQHGGEIEVRNRPGGGAEFLLSIPAEESPKDMEAGPPTQPAGSSPRDGRFAS